MIAAHLVDLVLIEVVVEEAMAVVEENFRCEEELHSGCLKADILRDNHGIVQSMFLIIGGRDDKTGF